MRSLTALAIGLLFPSASALAQFQPTTPPSKPEEAPHSAFPASPDKPQEFPGPRGTKITFPTGLYDENANAVEQIRVAREQAKRDNKRVLVMWGENKCGFCVFLNDLLLHDAVIAPLVKTDYVWVKVNIGKFDRNIDLANYYNCPIDQKDFGAPALLVIEPATDKAVECKGGNSMVAKPMQVDHVFDETIVRQFLMLNRAPMKVARTLVNDAAARAKGQKKNVLAYFTLPLCDPCDAMERWITGADAAPILEKAFVPVKIDVERTIGGRTILNEVSEGKVVGAPFIAIMTPSGDLAAPGASFPGLPKTTEEIARFSETLSRLAPSIDAAGRASLEKSLKAAAEAKPVEEAKK